MVETQSIMPRLACRNLQHSYGYTRILNGIDFDLKHGESLAILGRSGCGKSTLLRCLNLLEKPSDGDLELDGQAYMEHGKALFEPWQVRRQIAMVFQEYNLFPNMTVSRNITLALEKTLGLSSNDAKERAISVAARLGIDSTLDRYPETISGGQSQRLALARAIVLHPSVLMLDEVTSALDPQSISNMVEAVRQVRDMDEYSGLSILLVTHVLNFAVKFADQIAFLHDGRLIEIWPSDQFCTRCTHPAAKAFINQSTAIY